MNFIVKAREIVRNRVPTGRYRLTVETEADGTDPEPLCDCVGGHDSPGSARRCPKALAAALHMRETYAIGIEEPLPGDERRDASDFVGPDPSRRDLKLQELPH